MKIVDERPFRHEFTCKECESGLVAEAEDVGCFFSDGIRTYFASCPACGAREIIPFAKTNPAVREMADRKGEA